MATTQCLTDKNPFGNPCGDRTPLQKASALFFTLPDFSFATRSDAENQTKWLEAIRDEKIFPITDIDDEESKDVEARKETTPTGKTIKIADAQRGRRYLVGLPLITHQVFRGYSGAKFKLLIGDMGGLIEGTSPDGTKIQGYKLNFFDVEIQDWEKGRVTPIHCMFGDATEYDSRGRIITPTWSISDLPALTKVEATPSTVNQSTHVFTVQVNWVDETLNKTVPIEGLVAANFNLIKTGGTPTAVDSVSESTAIKGLYTITAHVGTFTSGTVQVIPSTTALYKSDIETVSAP